MPTNGPSPFSIWLADNTSTLGTVDPETCGDRESPLLWTCKWPRVTGSHVLIYSYSCEEILSECGEGADSEAHRGRQQAPVRPVCTRAFL